MSLFRRREPDNALRTGEALVTAAEMSGGRSGEAGTTAVIWHVHCRLHLSAEEVVDFETRVGSTFSSAGDLSFSVGDEIPVRYDPEKPHKAEVDVDAIRARREQARSARDATRLARAEHDAAGRMREATPAPAAGAESGTGFRLVVVDVVFAVGKVSVLGQVQGEAIRLGEQVTINGKRPAIVGGIEIFGAPTEAAEPGSHVALTFTSLDPSSIFKGDVISRG